MTGYCAYCNREVDLAENKRTLGRHYRYKDPDYGAFGLVECAGSYKMPGLPKAPEPTWEVYW